MFNHFWSGYTTSTSVLTVQPINTQLNPRTAAKPLTGSKKI